MTHEALRFCFLWSAFFVFALYKVIHIAWLRGRQSAKREHFSFILPRDESVRQRL